MPPCVPIHRQQADLYNTYFDDYAVRALDRDALEPVAAPFTGIFKPLFSLKRLIRGVDRRKHRAAHGGSKGSWSLTVTDRGIGPDDAPRGHIDDFAVILCTREKQGVDMDGFVDFADALREPSAQPVREHVVFERVMFEREAREFQSCQSLCRTPTHSYHYISNSSMKLLSLIHI